MLLGVGIRMEKQERQPTLVVSKQTSDIHRFNEPSRGWHELLEAPELNSCCPVLSTEV